MIAISLSFFLFLSLSFFSFLFFSFLFFFFCDSYPGCCSHQSTPPGSALGGKRCDPEHGVIVTTLCVTPSSAKSVYQRQLIFSDLPSRESNPVSLG